MVDFFINFFTGFLPGAVQAAVKWGFLVLANVLVVVLLVRHFRFREAVVVRTFGKPARESDLDGKALAQALRSGLGAIWEAHQGRSLSSAGEATSLADPRSEAEDLGSKAIRLMAGNSPVGFLVGLSSKFWPALELEGEVVVGDDWNNVWGVRLRRGKAYYHAWQTTVSEGAVEEAAAELAHRIAMDTARLGVLEESASGWSRRTRRGRQGRKKRKSAGTSDWRAFKALTEAMALWNSPDYSPLSKEQVDAVDAKLAKAIEYDPGYALALYNRGTLHLTTFSSPATNDLAMKYFEGALAAATDQAKDASQVKLEVDHRVRGMAYLGIARTCSQARHRFGRLDDAVVQRAREAAQEATVFLDESHESLYAKAFAWHCTETLEDIRVGREVYEQIVREAPKEHSAVHNNLGYILVKGGEHLLKMGKKNEAEAWWKSAEDHLKTTIEIEGGKGRWEFAHANLGDLYRLRKLFKEGEREYLKALGPDPKKSRYTNGLNELARLYLDWGQEDGDREKLAKAEIFHGLALATTDDEEVREKLKGEYSGEG